MPRKAENPVLVRLRSERGLAPKLAKELGLKSPNAVWQWFLKKKKAKYRRVPAEHLFKVSAFLGIPPNDIRPDLYLG
jgi:hypothetical protein